MNSLTKQAVSHTLHCLLGCSIGEILGMVLAEIFHWSNLVQTLLAIILAFFFGYLLTYRSARQRGVEQVHAMKMALATDTVSITSMETIDNVFIWLIPGAINATLSSFTFWWTLAAGLAIAFVITVPVNRYMIARNPHAHHHH